MPSFHFTNPQTPILSEIMEADVLQKVPYIVISSETQLNYLAKVFFKDYNLTPNILFEASDLEVLWDLSLQGIASTFVYEIFARKRLSNLAFPSSKPPVVIVPLNLPGADQRVILGYHAKRYVSWSMKNFIDLAIKTFANS